MNVKELIRKLKTMPQNLQVGVAMHDNDPGEIAGHAAYVYQMDDEYDPENPVTYVVIRC